MIPAPLVAAGTALSWQTGLLSNDALILAVMQSNGLSRLASSDQDFDDPLGDAVWARPRSPGPQVTLSSGCQVQTKLR